MENSSTKLVHLATLKPLTLLVTLMEPVHNEFEYVCEDFSGWLTKIGIADVQIRQRDNGVLSDLFGSSVCVVVDQSRFGMNVPI